MKLTDEMRAKLEAEAKARFSVCVEAHYGFMEGAEAALALVDESELVKALEWAQGEICEHARAFAELEKHPDMKRAFCSCSSWVYRGYVNEVDEALAKYRAGG